LRRNGYVHSQHTDWAETLCTVVHGPMDKTG
jgi:hypothetical protein